MFQTIVGVFRTASSFLFEPSRKVEQDEQRRQARLISATLFVFSWSTISGALFTPEKLELVRTTMQIAALPQVLLYLLSRTSYYRLAAVLAIPLLSATSYISLLYLPVYNQSTIAETIMWLVLPMGVAVITLSLPFIIIFLAINIILISTMPAWLAGFEAEYLGNGLSFVIISSLMLVVIAVIRNRDVSELHSLTLELQQQKDFLEMEIEERRQAELEIGNLQALINSVNESILLVSSTGLIEKVNDTSSEMFGYSQQRLVNKGINTIVATCGTGSGEQLFSCLLKAEKAGGARWQGFQAKRGDDTTFPAEAFATRIEFGGKKHFVVTIRDMTEHRRIEKMKDEFVSSVSHELRTPLTSIHGAVGIIKGRYGDALDDKLKQLINIAYDNSTSLSSLVEDILDISKLESGNLQCNFETVNLTGLMNDLLRNCAPLAEKYSIRFALADGLPEVNIETDKKRFAQVMNNLLSNAAKFSPQGDEVEIDYAVDGEWLRLSVTDHGSGIPPEYQDRIFEKFFQVQGTSKQVRSGTGLGLSISQRIIQQMGGRIWVDSMPGRTSFWIEIPMTQ